MTANQITVGNIMTIHQLLLAIATFCGGSGSYYTKQCSVRLLTCWETAAKINDLDQSLLICLKEEAAR
jgi:hypothetical protein